MKFGLGSRGGKGWAMCASCGFKVEAEARVWDRRQGWVHRDCADITPGYGTWHPRDRRPFLNLSDPTPIRHARTDWYTRSFQDLGISDAERLAKLTGIPLDHPEDVPGLVVTDEGFIWATDDGEYVVVGSDTDADAAFAQALNDAGDGLLVSDDAYLGVAG